MQGQLIDLRDAYKAIRKALFIKQGQWCECMQKDRQEGLKLLHQIQHLLFGLHINSEMKVFSNRSNKK